ncbi:unnamed protein product [Ceratitis capitata]|uniref:(Mediterranean fruit fly) hypothetical protein n=1 Tax=Ceratitis capitata TaxID=7213 RepID=A0A811UKM9_CERCA|nr:unnamed protein product [Ceratitis capitata]
MLTDGDFCTKSLTLAAISAPTTPTASASTVVTPTSPTPSVSTPADTPRLSLTTPILASIQSAVTPLPPSLVVACNKVVAEKVVIELGAEGKVRKEPVVVFDVDLAEEKGSTEALSTAETVSRNSIDCKADVALSQPTVLQPTTNESVSATPLTNTSAPDNPRTNGNVNSTELSNVNGNNNSFDHNNTNSSPKNGNTKCITPTNFAKGLPINQQRAQGASRNNYAKPKITLKMRFKVAKRICQRRIRAKNIDENFPQPR